MSSVVFLVYDKILSEIFFPELIIFCFLFQTTKNMMLQLTNEITRNQFGSHYNEENLYSLIYFENTLRLSCFFLSTKYFTIKDTQGRSSG